MKKWYLIIDIERCEGCHNCFLACKDEYVDNDWEGYSLAQPKHSARWMKLLQKERGQFPTVDVAYLPVACMHCDDAPCMKAAKDGAVYKRKDGIVLIDPRKAKGQREIVRSCPYQASEWNDEQKIAQKCTLCAHLLDQGWKEPRCVQACPTGALRVLHIEDAEMKGIAQSEDLELLHPEYGTRPRVYYKNLYRFFCCFIAGTVAFEQEGREECAEGARVLLFQGGKKIDEVVTDNYGDFKFDRLQENSGPYRLEVLFRDRGRKVLEVDLRTSITVGAILL